MHAHLRHKDLLLQQVNDVVQDELFVYYYTCKRNARVLVPAYHLQSTTNYHPNEGDKSQVNERIGYEVKIPHNIHCGNKTGYHPTPLPDMRKTIYRGSQNIFDLKLNHNVGKLMVKLTDFNLKLNQHLLGNLKVIIMTYLFWKTIRFTFRWTIIAEAAHENENQDSLCLVVT